MGGIRGKGRRHTGMVVFVVLLCCARSGEVKWRWWGRRQWEAGDAGVKVGA